MGTPGSRLHYMNRDLHRRPDKALIAGELTHVREHLDYVRYLLAHSPTDLEEKDEQLQCDLQPIADYLRRAIEDYHS